MSSYRYKLCDAYTWPLSGLGASVHPTHQVYLFIAFKGQLILLDLERSQKVDLGMCRSQGPIRSLSLEGKGLRRAPIGVITIIYLVN